eukprot:249614-Pelagomonas_calceolata.AAC.1
MSTCGLVGRLFKALSLKVRKGRACCWSGKVRFALPGFKFKQVLLECRPGLFSLLRLSGGHPSDLCELFSRLTFSVNFLCIVKACAGWTSPCVNYNNFLPLPISVSLSCISSGAFLLYLILN